ncbi:xanthine dehydrogenase family protein molybdopterin-binding subunit [Streptomyces albofaciens JCM 4342]|uniref:xanthine dehydrogenase family protein molybdopterin-binding subunit n=1 Tax=Streptomyces albofaciens TaxID=66866 RepID=UPI00123B79B8|nr:xanthine dehydrogenase family protein molybdopterin-binding subunit [Streptomyces albofaciens]KAA6212464.1 xanthine dehydrogenase family protein molybdopterin-binding subunit [Streptomyces albofaciens JCM 4342]
MITGRAWNRVDGPPKVTGRAAYAYERWEAGQPLYGVVVGATVGKGRITRIDTAEAERAPGVRMVLTHRNAPAQGPRDESVQFEYWRAQPVLTGPDVRHHGQPVAFVVATAFEQARGAAGLIHVEYAEERGRFDFAAHAAQAYAPKAVNAGLPTDTAVGDFAAGFAGAPVRIDRRYTTPYEFSMPMEPHACLVEPRGEDLIVHVSCQIVDAAWASVAATLGIAPERVHIVSPYVGGGFGSKLGVHAETILAALAARDLRRPVKVALTRQQLFQLVGLRPTSSQRVRLGAGRDGRLAAIGHDVTLYTSPDVEYAEQTAATSRSLYAAPHRATSHRLVPLDLPRGADVRAPGEAPGLLAVESAMDELADALGMDPVELRIRNEPAVDPERGVPYSDRHLVDCLREGARRFGWEHRPAAPASVREGRWLVGYGMSAAIRGHFQGPTAVRVRLEADGTAVVRTDMTDIGTGTYTVLTQVAADGLGLPPDGVRIQLGRSGYPRSWGSGGSWGAANSCTAADRACAALRTRLLDAARSDPDSPLYGLPPADAVFTGGHVRVGDASEPLGALVRRHHPEGLEAVGETRFMGDEPDYAAYSIHTYGAHFAEVGVDADTAEIRLRRMLGVFSVGRALNPKTARSQLIGGMIWGVGAALEEEAVVDPRSGAFVTRDLAHYLVPVHADVPDVDAVILDGHDARANALGAKGVGELGICGAGAAVANAVYNATGIRVRDFPITLEKLLPGLPVDV